MAQFVADGGYRTAALWLSDGWDWVRRKRIEAPLYWYEDEHFTHAGWQPRDRSAPVCHISYFEADAYATWAGMRLPTEFEWEAIAQGHDPAGATSSTGRSAAAGGQRLAVRRLLAVHPLGLPALSALCPGRGRGGRIQRQVHGRPVGAQGRQLRHRARPLARELPQLLLSRTSAGSSPAFGWRRTCDGPCGSLALIEYGEDGIATAFRADVLDGLAQDPKAVPARWLYDDAGSELFEAITRLPEYYLTRAETSILRQRRADFRRLVAPGRAVVEFGSGPR
jgi:hypothetical protein